MTPTSWEAVTEVETTASHVGGGGESWERSGPIAARLTPDNFSTALSVVTAATPLCRNRQQTYSCTIQRVKRSRRGPHVKVFSALRIHELQIFPQNERQLLPTFVVIQLPNAAHASRCLASHLLYVEQLLYRDS